jgi:hypothetical protein
MGQDLWEEVERKLHFHLDTTDKTEIDALNRIFSKVLARTGRIGKPPHLAPETCSIRMEKWPLERLDSLIRTHDRTSPKTEDPPIIAVEFGGEAFALDGTTRANKWIATKRPGPHIVILIATRPAP